MQRVRPSLEPLTTYVRRPFSEDPVDPECRRTSGHRDSSMRSHHAGAALIALASCSSTSRLQGCMSGAPVATGLTPAYLADDVRLVTDTDRRPLRSAAVRTCFVPRTRNSFGDRSFSAAGPRVWNSLPPHLRQDMNFARFQHKLKTFLFGK